MALFKKGGLFSKAVDKVKGSGIVSKIVSGIPIVGGFASAAIDIGTGLIGKTTGKEGTNTGAQMIAAYQKATGATQVVAEQKAQSVDKSSTPYQTPMKMVYIGIAFILGIIILIFTFGRKK